MGSNQSGGVLMFYMYDRSLGGKHAACFRRGQEPERVGTKLVYKKDADEGY